MGLLHTHANPYSHLVGKEHAGHYFVAWLKIAGYVDEFDHAYLIFVVVEIHHLTTTEDWVVN